jgi:hypothetical protein
MLDFRLDQKFRLLFNEHFWARIPIRENPSVNPREELDGLSKFGRRKCEMGGWDMGGK